MSDNVENKEIEVTNKKKSGSKKKVVIIVIVVAVLMIIGAIAMGKAIKDMSAGMQEAMEMMAGESEDLFEVQKEDISQEITTSGTVIGLERNAYTSPVTAKVDDIYVEVGQTVKAGDVLLTYDATELGDDLEKVQLQAQVERAAGNESYEMANEAAGKVSTAKKKIKELNEDIKTLNKEIKELSKEIAEYEKKMKAAGGATSGESGVENEENAEVTAPAPTLSEKEMKKYNKAVTELEKKNKSLMAKQEELAKQEMIVEANEDVKVSNSTKTQISVSNQISDMNINDAQARVDAAEAGIVAEKDGIVESIDIVKGTYAGETQTLLTIISADKIGVEFAISKDDLTSVAKGQKARVVVANKEYTGTVEFVSRVATMDANLLGSASASGGSIKGRIELDNPDDEIFVGVSAKAYIFLGESTDALVVPYSAICTDVEGDYVLVVNDNNIIERKDIKLGLCSGEYYEVLEGLAEGDKVITNVTKTMKPGDEYVPTATPTMPGMPM